MYNIYICIKYIYICVYSIYDIAYSIYIYISMYELYDISLFLDNLLGQYVREQLIARTGNFWGDFLQLFQVPTSPGRGKAG